MKLIKDYIWSFKEKDPYQDLWKDGEKPIITANQIEPVETEKQVLERLQARIEDLERRVRYLEKFGVLPR